MRYLLSFILVWSIASQAATYYVTTTGNDAADGSSGSPWLTITNAVAHVSAGDIVNVGAGEWRNFVNVTVSGDTGSPITFQGTRGEDGSWQTIIDPSFDMTNWVNIDGTEGASNGVWKTSGLSYPVRELTIGSDRKRSLLVYSPDSITTSGIGSVFTNSGITTGIQFLSTPTSLVLGNPQGTFNLWDHLGACYASTGSVCYIRFKAGDDPNTMGIRGMDDLNNAISGAQVDRAAVMINGRSNLVWKNFWVRGAPSGFQLRNAAWDNVIQSNKVTGCHKKIYAYYGSSDSLRTDNIPSRNQFTGNVLDGNVYNITNTGAWGTDAAYYTTASAKRRCHYEFAKYLIGQGSEYDEGITCYYAGPSNVIAWNTVTNSTGNGIGYRGDPFWHMTNTIVCSNYVAHHPSGGIYIYGSDYAGQIYDNTVYDCNASIRPMDDRSSDSGTNILRFIYRNRFQNPPHYGDGLYLYEFVNGAVSHTPTNWIYHNTFVGGYGNVGLSGYYAAEGGEPGYFWLNNIFDGADYWMRWSVGFDTHGMGACDYNLISTNWAPSITWLGANNVIPNKNEFVNTIGINFTPQVGSQAINMAEDLTSTYPSLPQDSTVRVGPAWDIGAAELLYFNNGMGSSILGKGVW